MKKNRVALLIILLVLSFTFVFAEDVTVQLNGNPVLFDVQPQIMQSRTMVPIRAIFEALGLDVGWDPATRTVTGTGNGKVITLQIGNLNATVNGEPITLDVSAVIVNGRTLVPIRFIAESIGAEVGWVPEIRRVTIGYYADEEDKLKAEINTLLSRETQAMNEWKSQVASSETFKAKALSEVARLKTEYKRLNNLRADLMAKYPPVDLNGDTYYGALNTNRQMNGFGYYVYTDGDYYIGDIVNGDYSGYGLYSWSSGDYYIGNFKDGYFNGLGFVNGNEDYYKYGTYKNDKSSGQFYYEDFNDDYVFIGQMDGPDFLLGRQINSNGSEHISWNSPVYKKLMIVEEYSDGEYLIYEEADKTTQLSFTVETYFGDTHLIRYMNLKTDEVVGNGVSYIVGSDYVYYGEFFDRYYESALDVSYYNMKGNFYEFRDKIDAIITEVIRDGMTDLEKEQALHDYLVGNSIYNPDKITADLYPTPQHMAYEIILNGEGICEAYAEALNILLNRVGIKAIIIGGSVGEPNDQKNWGGHAWNYVRVNGGYYHLDATWNDPVPDNGSRVSQVYFNKSDSFMAQDHEWEESYDEIEAFKAAYPLN